MMLPFSVFSQQAGEVKQPGKAFVTLISSNDVNNYFSLDLENLPGFFEKAYLLDLIFADPNLVVNNTNISGSSLELFSNKMNDPVQLLKSLESYREKATTAGTSLSEEKKKDLLKKYDKYR
jgi:hypothetical protein